jgi:hypothetical protein
LASQIHTLVGRAGNSESSDEIVVDEYVEFRVVVAVEVEVLATRPGQASADTDPKERPVEAGLLGQACQGDDLTAGHPRRDLGLERQRSHGHAQLMVIVRRNSSPGSSRV